MSTLGLDICLVLALAGMLFVSCTPLLSWGPEGGVGVWLVAIPPLIFFFFALLGVLIRGRFDWIPGGKATGLVMLIGLTIALGAGMLAAFENSGPFTNRLLALSPYVMIACCAIVLHGWAARTGAVAATAMLGAGSLFGWGLAVQGALNRAAIESQQADLRAEQAIAVSSENSARDLAEFHSMPVDAPLSRVLPFQFSSNDAVQRECLDRIAHWPDLDGELIQLLDKGSDGADWAARYIAGGLDSPSARLAPAFGRYLDRGLERWRTDLIYGKDYAAKWEPDLQPYFRAARRIQKAGGDLRPHLKPWYDLLIQIPGLRAMARDIRQPQ